jgi:hypothetical protein
MQRPDSHEVFSIGRMDGSGEGQIAPTAANSKKSECLNAESRCSDHLGLDSALEIEADNDLWRGVVPRMGSS